MQRRSRCTLSSWRRRWPLPRPPIRRRPPGSVTGALSASGDLTGVVRDSAGGQGLVGGDVVVSRDGRVVARSQTDPTGPIQNPQPSRRSVRRRGAARGLSSGRQPHRHRGGRGDGSARRSRAVRRTARGAGDDRARAGGGRYAHRQSGVQAEQLSRRSHADHVADPAAVHRRRRSRAHRRGPYPRPARRVHVLHRWRSGAARHLRQPERGVHTRCGERDLVSDRGLGRGVRKQERRDRRREHEGARRRAQRRCLDLRRVVRGQRANDRCEPEHRQARLVRLRDAAGDRHAAGAGDVRHAYGRADQLPQPRRGPVHLREASIPAHDERRRQSGPELVADPIRGARSIRRAEPSATITSRTSTASPTWGGGTSFPAAAAGRDQSCSWRRFIGGAVWPTPRE